MDTLDSPTQRYQLIGFKKNQNIWLFAVNVSWKSPQVYCYAGLDVWRSGCQRGDQDIKQLRDQTRSLSCCHKICWQSQTLGWFIDYYIRHQREGLTTFCRWMESPRTGQGLKSGARWRDWLRECETSSSTPHRRTKLNLGGDSSSSSFEWNSV